MNVCKIIKHDGLLCASLYLGINQNCNRKSKKLTNVNNTKIYKMFDENFA